jgi:PAS domain S-box-containing protein
MATKIRSLLVTETQLGWGLLVLCVGVLTVCGGLVAALNASAIATHAKFERLSQSVSEEISRRLLLPGYGLGGARGAIAVKGSVPSVEEFRRYVDSRDLPVEFPGVTGIGLIIRVQRQNLAAFEQNTAAQYGRDFPVRTSGNQADLYVIRSIEPRDVNAQALGFDVGAEPSRRAAVERSYKLGLPSATAPIRLLQDDQHRLGTLYLVPVFASGRPARASDSDSVIGVVYAAMTYDVLLDNVDSNHGDSINVVLRDLEAPASEQLIFGSTESARSNAALKEVRRIDFGGRTLELTLTSTEEFEAAQLPWEAWLAALAGFLASVFAAILVVKLSSTRLKARAVAKAMTIDLDLFKVMAEQSDQAAMLLDSSGKVTWLNTAMLDLTGSVEKALVGQRGFESLIVERTDIDELGRLRRSMTTKESFQGTLVSRTPEGQDLPSSARVLPSIDRNGICTGFIVFMSPTSKPNS